MLQNDYERTKDNLKTDYEYDKKLPTLNGKKKKQKAHLKLMRRNWNIITKKLKKIQSMNMKEEKKMLNSLMKMKSANQKETAKG